MNLYSNPELFTNQHLEHQRHLPVLQQLQKQISKALSSVDLDKCGDLKFVSKVCCLTISRVIDDLNRAILQSLEIGSYSAAESLSRTSLENSINLILFSEDKTNSRPKSMLLHYFKTSKSRANKWHRYGKDNDDLLSVSRALEFKNSLAITKGLFDELDENSEDWPSAYKRFKDAEYESAYHILFMSASDSIHGFSNDIFNNVLGETLPLDEAEKTAYFEGQLAEKISFAYYLATSSILFYCAAASHIAFIADDAEVRDKLQIISKALENMLAEHEALTATFLDSLAQAQKRLEGEQNVSAL